ncbi:MAG: HD family hydrolase, partial [Pseudomonadota bacterium]
FGLPAKTPSKLKKLIKRADHISAWFEATQLAGFTPAEANQFFGKPPCGVSLTLDPLAPDQAQTEFVARTQVLLAGIDTNS